MASFNKFNYNNLRLVLLKHMVKITIFFVASQEHAAVTTDFNHFGFNYDNFTNYRCTYLVHNPFPWIFVTHCYFRMLSN